MKNNNPLDYAHNMGKALSAWRDENEEKRAVILLSMAETDDKADESGRQISVYTDGSPDQLINLLAGVLEKNEDFYYSLVGAIRLKNRKKG